jgi:hypothetical protein
VLPLPLRPNGSNEDSSRTVFGTPLGEAEHTNASGLWDWTGAVSFAPLPPKLPSSPRQGTGTALGRLLPAC